MFGFITFFALLLAGGGGAESEFMQFYNQYLNYPGFEVWRLVNLLIFISIMIYILKKPLSAAFKAKREEIRADLIAAEQEKAAAKARLTEIEAKVAQLENERAEIMANAKYDVKVETARILEQTEDDIRRLKDQAASEIARLTAQRRKELRRFSANESIRLAEEKLRSRIDTGVDTGLVRNSVNEIGGVK